MSVRLPEFSMCRSLFVMREAYIHENQDREHNHCEDNLRIWIHDLKVQELQKKNGLDGRGRVTRQSRKSVAISPLCAQPGGGYTL